MSRSQAGGYSRPGTRAGGRVVCGGGGPGEHGEGAVSEADGRCLASDPPHGVQGGRWGGAHGPFPGVSLGRNRWALWEARGASPQVCSGCRQNPVPFKTEAPGSWWPSARGHPGLHEASVWSLHGAPTAQGIASRSHAGAHRLPLTAASQTPPGRAPLSGAAVTAPAELRILKSVTPIRSAKSRARSHLHGCWGFRRGHLGDRAWPSHNRRRVSATCDNEGSPRHLRPSARTSVVSQLWQSPVEAGVLVTPVSPSPAGTWRARDTSGHELMSGRTDERCGLVG